MDIVAIIACRNEEAYLANCLRHLLDNGIRFAVIDNQSVDGTLEILKRRDLRRGLVALETLPFDGVFALQAQLRAKEELAQRLPAEWIIHLDADEIMHSANEGESLHDAIARLAAEGANVINFDEFVFLPIEHDYQIDSPRSQPMRHYYFFEPKPQRLMRAWRKDANFTITEAGGHGLSGENRRLAPESLALRHYIFLNQEHAFCKYPTRRFDEREVQGLHWHGNRIDQPSECFRFPLASTLDRLDRPCCRSLSRTNPRKQHYWQWKSETSSRGRSAHRRELVRRLFGFYH